MNGEASVRDALDIDLHKDLRLEDQQVGQCCAPWACYHMVHEDMPNEAAQGLISGLPMLLRI